MNRMQLIKKIVVVGAIGVIFFASAGAVMAQGMSGPVPIPLTDPLGCNQAGTSGGNCFQQVAGNILTFLITIGAAIMAILVAIGGFQMMTAAGDPEKFSKGKKTLIYAAVGFAVLILAQGAVSLVKSILAVGQ